MPVSSDRALQRQGSVARGLWMAGGLMLVGIGIVGMFVPLLPTTDFMILALPCFARSSPRLEGWLLHHPRFGTSLQAWRHQRAVPRHAKIAACGGMAAGYAIFHLAARPDLIVAIPVAAVMAAAAIWVVRRPEPDCGPGQGPVHEDEGALEQPTPPPYGREQ